MIRIPLLLLLFLSFCQVSVAQQKVDTSAAALLNELSQLLDSADNPISYVSVSVGMGNRLFSIKNNALNSKRVSSGSSTSFVLSPSVGYYHKSGFSLSAGNNLVDVPGKGMEASQYSITPGYELQGNSKFGVGVSYTRYFVKDKYSAYASPVQNDFYGSFAYKKLWLQPGISFGYSTGDFGDLRTRDTVINNVRRYFYDSANNHIRSFSMILSAAHEFEWYALMSKHDGLSLSLTAMLNMSSSVINITHKTNAPLVSFLNRRGKLPRIKNEPFNVQSAGLNIDLNYTIGKFFIEPQLYLDYYLQSTTDKKFTQVFNLNLGYNFYGKH